MSEELKNCPFCGGDDKEVKDNGFVFYVECNKCKCSTCVNKYENEAIKAWNTRLEPDVEQKPERTSIGIKDKNGVEVCVGDWLDFDETEWGGTFEIEQVPPLLDLIGEWSLCGTKSDVSEWRQIVSPPVKKTPKLPWAIDVGLQLLKPEKPPAKDVKEALGWVDDATKDIEETREKLNGTSNVLNRAERCLGTIKKALEAYGE